MFSGYGMEPSAGRRAAVLDGCPGDSESTLKMSVAQGRPCRPSTVLGVVQKKLKLTFNFFNCNIFNNLKVDLR